MKRLTIDPVSRIEGHAKISIHLNDEGRVSSTQLHITQIRGFEKFTEGRPFYEMPGITSRICGICPVSHLLASAKACDGILAVRIPAAAIKLRELLHCAQFVQSHALSFFYLSSPDLLLGMDSDPAKRNVIGVIEKHPELARLGIELRKFGLQIIEGLAQERVHPSWVVPGGVNAPMSPQLRDRIFTGRERIGWRELSPASGHGSGSRCHQSFVGRRLPANRDLDGSCNPFAAFDLDANDLVTLGERKRCRTSVRCNHARGSALTRVNMDVEGWNTGVRLNLGVRAGKFDGLFSARERINHSAQYIRLRVLIQIATRLLQFR